MITYKKGNLLESHCDIIVHQANCKRVMGRGIAKQIRDKWPSVYIDYCKCIDYMMSKDTTVCSRSLLGLVSWTNVEEDKYVVNFFSQDNYMPAGKCHTDYEAFRVCCREMKTFLLDSCLQNSVIGFPYKIGCGLAGGDWSIVSKIIEEELSDYNVEIWEY